MAEQKISFSVEVSAQDAIAKTGSLKAAIKEAEKQAAELTLKGFGDQALIAAKNAAKLKEELADVKDRIAALNPEAKFTSITAAASGIAGGFAAAQGAMALFGNESKDVEKAILKVQSAMAISEGLNSIRGMGDAFGNLKILIVDAGIKMAAYLGIVEGASIATNALNIATKLFTASTGGILLVVGALVTGVTLLVSWLKSEEAAHEAVTAAIEKERKARIEGVKAYTEALKQSQTEHERLRKENVAGMLQTRELEINEENRRAATEAKKLKDMTELTKGSELAKDNERLAQQKHLQNLAAINKKHDDEEAKAKKDKADKAKIEADKQHEKELKELQDKVKEDAEHQKFLDQVAKDKLANHKTIEVEKSSFDSFNADANKAARDKRAADEITLEQNLSAAKTQIATDTITALGLITEIGLGNSKEAMEFQKALALFQIGVDTATAISGLTAISFAPTPDNLINPAAPYLKIAAGTIAILSNINKAKNLLSGGGGSPTAPTMNIPKAPTTGSAAPNVSQQQQGLQQTVTTVGAGGQATSGYLRAYVVESEMTDKQKRINQIQKNTKF